MAKIKTVCGQCKNCCPEGITLFQKKSEVEKLVETFPFYKIVRSGTGIIGKIKKEYHLLKCERLNKDGFCTEPPENTPAWCRVED